MHSNRQASLAQAEPPPRLDGKKSGEALNGHARDDVRQIANHDARRPSESSVLMENPEARMALEPFENGYHFPPSYSFGESFKRGLISFGKYCLTPLGFFVVLYGLLVVAWGGMLFLLLCNAAPAMCYPTCDNINSPRRIWIEYDSQIVNALFCVTGFGLAPWRFRDLYYLLQYRILRRTMALRRLAGIHRGWFRLPGSQKIPVEIGPGNIDTLPAGQPNEGVPFPESKVPGTPLTGVRAVPTALWKMDFVIWSNIWNTFFQCCLSGFMWGMNRINRPSFAVGLFVGLAMVVAAMGGLMMFFEGKRVKKVEGVPVTEQDLERLARDKELGIVHYNNISDKKPKEKDHGRSRFAGALKQSSRASSKA